MQRHCSALVALHEPYLSLKDGIRSQRARFVVEGITHTIRTSLLEQQCLVGRDPESVSPWGLFFGYRICVYYACSDQKEAYALQIVDSLKEVFRNIEVRWNAAGKLFSGYLFIVAGIDHYSQVSTFGFWKHTRS